MDTVKNMIAFYANICFPDYTNPCFSDAKLGDYQAELANYRDWLALFPDCDWIRYYATEGREGAPFLIFPTGIDIRFLYFQKRLEEGCNGHGS